MSPAQATANAPAAAAPRQRTAAGDVDLPLEHLSLEETLRVMDVAREMRDHRQTAEQMFRRDDLRIGLRDKLIRQARLSGEDVTEAEIDAAIDQYLETLHVYQDPPAGFGKWMAHAWVYRARIFLGSVAAAAVAAGTWWLMF